MMQEAAKDRAPREVVELKVSFEMALSSKRKYPAEEFCAFVQSVRRYIELTKHDAKMHKIVAEAVHELTRVHSSRAEVHSTRCGIRGRQVGLSAFCRL